MYRTILVPLDGSALAERVLPHAEKLAASGGRLVLLTVVEPTVPYVGDLPGEAAPARDVERFAARMRAESERRLQEAEAYLATARGKVGRADVSVATRAVEGNPVERILEAAGEAELVAMSTHGRTGLAHLLMGSVAERMVRRAPVPVLVFRPTLEAPVARRA